MYKIYEIQIYNYINVKLIFLYNFISNNDVKKK